MRTRSIRVAFVLACLTCLSAYTAPAWCQALAEASPPPPSAAAAGESEESERANRWTVGLSGGLLEGAYIKFASEIGRVVDDGENLRVLPVLTKGSVQNVNDLLYLRGIDAGLVSADTFDEIIKAGKIKNIENRIQFITQVHVNLLQLMVRGDIKTLSDLKGQKVAVAAKGSSSAELGIKVLQRFGVTADVQNIGWTAGLEKVKSGEFAGVFSAFAKGGTTLYSSVDKSTGLHLLSIPFDKFADEYYVPVILGNEDYPNLFNPGETVETLGSPVVLAVYNWPRGTDRFRKVARFIEYFFNRFEDLRKPPYQAAWKEINPAAKVPGWKRYWYAEEMLAKYLAARGTGSSDTAGVASQTANPGDAGPQTAEQRRLFKEFLEWKKTQPQPQPNR